MRQGDRKRERNVAVFSLFFFFFVRVFHKKEFAKVEIFVGSLALGMASHVTHYAHQQRQGRQSYNEHLLC